MSDAPHRNERLAQALKDRGIETEKDRTRFAWSLDITPRTLHRWLHEGTAPQPDRQKKLARRLKVKPEELWP